MNEFKSQQSIQPILVDSEDCFVFAFAKNSSKNYVKAVEFAIEKGAEQAGEWILIRIPLTSIYNAYKRIYPLFKWSARWKYVKGFFRGKEVPPYVFLMRLDEYLDSYGQMDFITSDWGVPGVNIIRYKISGTPDYKNNKKFWYNFGSFKFGQWHVDKDAILNKLLLNIYERGLDLHPLYDENILRRRVADLPDIIDVDGKFFDYYYREQYVKNEVIKVPVNIRHTRRFQY